MNLRCSRCDSGRYKSYKQLSKHWKEADHPGKAHALPFTRIIKGDFEPLQTIPVPKRKKRRPTKAVKALPTIDRIMAVSSLPAKDKPKVSPVRSDVSLCRESANPVSIPASLNLKCDGDFRDFEAYCKRRN